MNCVKDLNQEKAMEIHLQLICSRYTIEKISITQFKTKKPKVLKILWAYTLEFLRLFNLLIHSEK